MSKTKIVAVKGKLIFHTSNGEHCEMGFVIPEDVLLKVQETIMNWKKEWVATTETHLEYKKVSKKLTAPKANKD